MKPPVNGDYASTAAIRRCSRPQPGSCARFPNREHWKAIMKDIKALETLLSARMPIVAIESREENKVLEMMERFAALNDRTLLVWSLTHGLRRRNSNESIY